MSAYASRFGRVLIAAAVCVCALPAGDGYAQPSKSATDEARELAREGWKALDAQNYKEALEKVTKAEALYHAPVHLLLMGNAQAGLGSLADALATFETLAAEPLPDAAPQAFKDAQENGKKRMKELLARVPSVLITVENADAASPAVQVDGKAIELSGVAMRLNPGAHEISVTAEGFEPLKKSITLPEKGGVVKVPIVLEKKRAPGGAASGTASAAASSTASAGPSGAPTTTSPLRTRVPAYVAFAVGGASIVVGAVTGAISLSLTGELKGVCPDGLCPESARAKLDRANALASASTATFVIGGVAAAAGVALLAIDIEGEPAKPRSSKVTIEPWISAGGAGLQGRF